MDDLERLADDFDAAGDDLGRAVDGLVRSTTLRTETLGQAFTPIRTGVLRASFTHEFDGGPRSDRITGTTGPEADYAGYVHDGTSRQAPQPFLDRAADITEPEFYAAAEAIVGTVGPGRG